MDKKIKLGYAINIGFAVAIAVATACFLLVDCSRYITKSIDSVLFVLCGVFNVVYSGAVLKSNYKKMFGILLLVGLVFACIGDILLIDNFIMGAIFFAIGHVLFVASFCFESKLRVRDVIIGVAIFIGAFLVIELYKGFNFDGMKVLILVYALIISLMLGKAISNAFNDNDKAVKLLVVIGASLFFISDLMLLFYVFGPHIKIFDIICVVTYYIAEFLLAFSIFVCSARAPKEPSRHEIKQ